MYRLRLFPLEIYHGNEKPWDVVRRHTETHSLPRTAKSEGASEKARAPTAPALKEAFTLHRHETKVQVECIHKIFETLGKRAQGKTCQAIDGILEEGSELMEDCKGSPVLDASMAAVAQPVEHHEMACYGAISCCTGLRGYDDAVALLEATLQEDRNADQKLSTMADAVKPFKMAAE